VFVEETAVLLGAALAEVVEIDLDAVEAVGLRTVSVRRDRCSCRGARRPGVEDVTRA